MGAEQTRETACECRFGVQFILGNSLQIYETDGYK